MAEALLNHVCGEKFEAFSAGLEAGSLNSLAVEAMRQIGLDISGNQTKKVWKFPKDGGVYSDVITVCDEASAKRCPVFPFGVKRLHWSFADPSAFAGPLEQRLAKTIEVRDQILAKILDWCAVACAPEKPSI